MPSRCLAVSVAMMLIGVLLNYLAPARCSITPSPGRAGVLVWTWDVIVVSHMGYRRAVPAETKPAVVFRLPGAPATNWLALGFMAVVVILMALNPDTRIAFYAASVWFANVMTCRTCSVSAATSARSRVRTPRSRSYGRRNAGMGRAARVAPPARYPTAVVGRRRARRHRGMRGPSRCFRRGWRWRRARSASTPPPRPSRLPGASFAPTSELGANINPHSARCPAATQLPATSCLGAFWTPAA